MCCVFFVCLLAFKFSVMDAFCHRNAPEKKERKKWPRITQARAACVPAVPSAQMGRIPAARKPGGVGLGERWPGVRAHLKPSGTAPPGLALALETWLPSPHAHGSGRAAAPLTGGGPSSAHVFNRWLPESARWLIITGKPERALEELKKAARINGHREAKKALTIERC